MSAAATATSALPPSERAAVRVDVLLITANRTEADAANELLSLRHEWEVGEAPNALPYRWDYVTTPGSNSPLVVGLVWLADDLGAVPAYKTARNAIELLHPRYFIVIGTAAGVATKDVCVRPGDVVYSRLVRFGPEGRGNTLREVAIHQPSPTLIDAAERLVRSSSWRTRVDDEKWKSALKASGLPEEREPPKVVGGEVVSKDGFVAPLDPFVSNCVEHYRKLAAFDMETGGVAKLCREIGERDRPPGYLFVKGVSDNVYDEDKNDDLQKLTIKEREMLNKEERERWKPFASHVSVAFVQQLLYELRLANHHPAHPEVLLCPLSKPVEVNAGCIGVYTAVEPEAYSKFAARLLEHIAWDASREPRLNGCEHFFTVCAYSPRTLWDAIVQAAERQRESVGTLKEVYEFAVQEFPHFTIFMDHVSSYGSGVRILLLEDFRTWLPRHDQKDLSRCTMPDHWKLFLLLNGYDENGDGKGVPFWGIDREALLRVRRVNRSYRFLTDYVLLGREFLLDYYDDAGVLIASEGERNPNREYFMDLYELFLGKRKRATVKPFKTREELHAEAVEAFRQAGVS